MVDRDLPRRRMTALLQQIRHDHRDRGGWQEKTARQLGVTQGAVSAVVNGTRAAGLDMIAGAIFGLGLEPAFFFDADLDEPHYRDHLSARKLPRDPEVEAVVLELQKEQGFSDEIALLLSDQRPPPGLTPDRAWALMLLRAVQAYRDRSAR